MILQWIAKIVNQKTVRTGPETPGAVTVQAPLIDFYREANLIRLPRAD